jgi:hypothetical protein
MKYHVVYDVRDAGWSLLTAGETHFMLVGLGVTILLGFLYWRGMGYINGRRTSEVDAGKKFAGLFLPLLFALIGGWQVATNNYPAYLENRRFQEWVRQGDYQTVEGAVTDYSLGRKYGSAGFRVGDVRFTYPRMGHSKGSFRGQFTAPGTESLRLENGVKVRVAHREGRILRIEIAE